MRVMASYVWKYLVYVIGILFHLTIATLATSSISSNNPEITFSDYQKESLKFKSYIFMAQEEAKCLKKYGKAVQPQDHSSAIFGRYFCFKSSAFYADCIQKLAKEVRVKKYVLTQQLLIKQREEEEQDHQLEQNYYNLHGRHTKHASIFGLQAPEIFCEDSSLKSRQDLFHTVFLKWNVKLLNQTYEKHSIPIVYVLEINEPNQNKSNNKWSTVGKTVDNNYTISTPYESKTYKFRLTAVSYEGIILQVTSNSITTQDGFVEPGTPKELHISQKLIKNESLDILIAWKPPPDKPCYYKIIQHPHSDHETVVLRLSAYALQHQYAVWFTDLSFDKTYDFGISTRRGTWDGYQSNLVTATFKMISCLEAFNYSFAKCEPPPPTNIRQEKVILVKMSNGTQKAQIKIHWTPPQYTSHLNIIKSYTLFTNPTKLNYSKFHMSNLTTMENYIHLPGNSTQHIFNNMDLNSTFSVALASNSVKGSSIPAYFVVSTYFAGEPQDDNFILQWIYLLCFLCALIFFVKWIYCIWKCKKKRNDGFRRVFFFKSTQEKDSTFNDLSLAEDAQSIDLFDNISEERWKIPHENLLVENVIGSGAFGVVKKAKLFKTRISNTTPDSEFDIVAVKMLKVTASIEDRNALIQEIITMHNVDKHPQIVELLGACIRGSNLYLLMDYCPGGDLLSFLRKVRETYLPTLGLRANTETKVANGSPCISKKSNKTYSGDNNSHSCGADFSSIKYAIIQNLDDSPAPSNEIALSFESSGACAPPASLQSTTQLEAENIESTLDNDGCMPINEKDVLRYAWQISIGMEYLARNKIVHRDLAARNILLMGDCKRVKISDFGLSRDIYSQNIYIQKKDRKLPYQWMAWESIHSNMFTVKSDVWSYGILLWEMVTLGATPYPGVDDVFEYLRNGSRMERPDNCSKEIYALMSQCWNALPDGRPSFTEIGNIIESMMNSLDPTMYLNYRD